jgi:hypothetical protein
MTCPTSCPKFKKICVPLGIIGFIAALVLWFGAKNQPAWEFVAHRERMAIMVAVVANILLTIGKSCSCNPCGEGKGESCSIK